ncbi:MAG TPA: hypothetical protein VGL86_06070 [Polyangia bacterium]|jgi:hypothetical protein
MSRPLAFRCALVAALALASCSNAYLYRTTRLAAEPPRPPAQPALAIPPTGAREIGVIEAILDSDSGGGGEGLHDSEADFYPRLAALAGALGGTHFVILRVTRAPRAWITSLTAAVYASDPSP